MPPIVIGEPDQSYVIFLDLRHQPARIVGIFKALRHIFGQPPYRIVHVVNARLVLDVVGPRHRAHRVVHPYQAVLLGAIIGIGQVVHGIPPLGLLVALQGLDVPVGIIGDVVHPVVVVRILRKAHRRARRRGPEIGPRQPVVLVVAVPVGVYVAAPRRSGAVVPPHAPDVPVRAAGAPRVVKAVVERPRAGIVPAVVIDHHPEHVRFKAIGGRPVVARIFKTAALWRVDGLELPLQVIHIVDALQVPGQLRALQRAALVIAVRRLKRIGRVVRGGLHPGQLPRHVVRVAVHKALPRNVPLVVHRRDRTRHGVVDIVDGLGPQALDLLHQPRHPAVHVIAVPARRGGGSQRIGLAHVPRHELLGGVLCRGDARCREGGVQSRCVRLVVHRHHLFPFRPRGERGRIGVRRSEPAACQYPALHRPPLCVVVGVRELALARLEHVLGKTDLAVLPVFETGRALVRTGRGQQLPYRIVRERTGQAVVPRGGRQVQRGVEPRRLHALHEPARTVVEVKAVVVIVHLVAHPDIFRAPHQADRTATDPGVREPVVPVDPGGLRHTVQSRRQRRLAVGTALDPGLRHQVVDIVPCGPVAQKVHLAPAAHRDVDVHEALRPDRRDHRVRRGRPTVLVAAARGRQRVAVAVREHHALHTVHVTHHRLGRTQMVRQHLDVRTIGERAAINPYLPFHLVRVDPVGLVLHPVIFTDSARAVAVIVHLVDPVAYQLDVPLVQHHPVDRRPHRRAGLDVHLHDAVRVGRHGAGRRDERTVPTGHLYRRIVRRPKSIVQLLRHGHRERVPLRPLLRTVHHRLVPAHDLLYRTRAQLAVHRPGKRVRRDVLVGLPRVARTVVVPQRIGLCAHRCGRLRTGLEVRAAVAGPAHVPHEPRRVHQAAISVDRRAQSPHRRAAVAVVERLRRPHPARQDVQALHLHRLAQRVEVRPGVPRERAVHIVAPRNDAVADVGGADRAAAVVGQRIDPRAVVVGVAHIARRLPARGHRHRGVAEAVAVSIPVPHRRLLYRIGQAARGRAPIAVGVPPSPEVLRPIRCPGDRRA